MRGITNQLKTNRKITTLFLVAIGAFCTVLSGLAFLLSNPFHLSNADAADASIPAQASKVSVNVYDLISLSLNDEINVEITPTDVAYNNLKTSHVTNVSVSTNVANGYTLYIADLDNDTNLINKDSASHKIAALSNMDGNSVKDWEVDGETIDFANNSWGYSINYDSDANKGTFHGIEYGKTKLKRTEEPTTLDKTSLTIAARVDTTVAAGTYIDTIVLSALPNSMHATSWDNIVYMQQMEQSTCKSAPSPTDSFAPTKSLIDVRDGNTYMVSKLMDGNCWMTQNLALSFKDGKALNPLTNKGEIELTSANTDLGYAAYIEDPTDPANIKTWVPVSDTYTTAGSHLANQPSVERSYSNGTVYYGDNTSSDGAAATKYTNLAACMAKYTSDECQHYKLGNLYNWTAATAGSSVLATTANSNATDSICPKGWQLPLNSGTKSWSAITSLYVGSSLKTDNAEKAPLYLVRGGYFNVSNGNLSNQGNFMNYWSATASSGTDAYYQLAQSSNSWNSQYSDSRARGFSVRCVLR